MPYKTITPTISLSALKDFTSTDLLAVYQPTDVTLKGEVVAVLVPITEYLRIQKLILDADANLDKLQNELGHAVFGSDNKW